MSMGELKTVAGLMSAILNFCGTLVVVIFLGIWGDFDFMEIGKFLWVLAGQCDRRRLCLRGLEVKSSVLSSYGQFWINSFMAGGLSLNELLEMKIDDFGRLVQGVYQVEYHRNRLHWNILKLFAPCTAVPHRDAVQKLYPGRISSNCWQFSPTLRPLFPLRIIHPRSFIPFYHPSVTPLIRLSISFVIHLPHFLLPFATN